MDVEMKDVDSSVPAAAAAASSTTVDSKPAMDNKEAVKAEGAVAMDTTDTAAAAAESEKKVAMPEAKQEPSTSVKTETSVKIEPTTAAATTPASPSSSSSAAAPTAASSAASSSAAAAAAAPASKKPDSDTEDEADEFVAFPKWKVPRDAYGRFQLPHGWGSEGLKKKAAEKEKKEKEQGISKKQKTGDGSAKAASSSSGADGKDPAAEKERRQQEKERELEKLNKIVLEPGLTAVESFKKLVHDVLDEGGQAAPTDAESRQLREAQTYWEIPYMSHFTWLFQKPLGLRALQPRRMEEILLHPNDILNESEFSEFASKLLFATRLHYTPHLKKSLAFMGKNQRCFDSELISEWMFWLVEIWIEQHKQKKKEEQEAAEAENEEQDEDDEEGGHTGRRRGAAAASSRRGGGRKPAAANDDSDSDLSENEDEEEKEAYNIHAIPDRKWKIDTEELFGNVNPFTGEAPAPAIMTATNEAPAAAAAAVASSAADPAAADAAASSSSDAAAAPAAAAASAAAAAAPSTPAVVLPIRRKSFYQLSLAHRVAIMKTLCDFQLAVNPSLSVHMKGMEDRSDMHLVPKGVDCSGKKFFFFGLPDFRIYAQNTAEWVRTPLSAEEIAEQKREKEEYEAEVKREFERLKKEAEEQKAKEKLERKLKKEKEAAAEAAAFAAASTPSKKKKKVKEENGDSAAVAMDEDTPLSSIVVPETPKREKGEKTLLEFWSTGPVTPKPAATAAAAAAPAAAAAASSSSTQPPAPISSLSLLQSPSKSTKSSTDAVVPPAATPAPTADAAAASPNATEAAAAPAAAASASSEPAPAAAAASSAAASSPAAPAAPAAPVAPAKVYEHGLPFPLLPASESVPVARPITFVLPPAPLFSLVTCTASQMHALVARLKTVNHKRNQELAEKLQALVEELEEGRGRVEEEETKKNKGKPDLSAPKRVSDRLVTLEAQREEAERMRAIRIEEESRSRVTRRTRWLDDISQRNVAKIRRSYEKLMGIGKEKTKKENESGTDGEDEESNSGRRGAGRKGRSSGRGQSSNGGSRARVTRNRGKSTKNLAEQSETETEDDDEGEEEEEEEEAEDDEGCAKCSTVVPPEDGSNPILLCDHCDKQFCLKCIPLERVPYGKYFCEECLLINPRLR